MIGMILQSAAEDGRLSKHKPKNNRPTQWTCTCGPEPKGKTSMDTSTFTSLANYMKRKLKSFVFGLPLHSHAAERAVNAGSGLAQKGAPHTSQVKLCGLLATILDEARVCERERDMSLKGFTKRRAKCRNGPLIAAVFTAKSGQ